MKKNLIKAALAVAVVAGTTTSAFAISPAFTWIDMTRANSAGTTWKELSNKDTTFCFLTQVRVEETDTGGESAQCNLIQSGSSWWLGATLGASSDADVTCGARCYTTQ